MENSLIDTEVQAFREEEGDTVLIDLRDRADYEAGHIPGAQHVSQENLREEIRRIARFNTRILVYCYIGKRSQQAEEMLKARGYENALNIGGIDEYSGDLEPALTVRQMRERKKLSQAELAEAVGIRQPTVAAYECGKANPGQEIRDRIRKRYCVTIAPIEKSQSEYYRRQKQKAARKGAYRTRKVKPSDVTGIRELREACGLTQAALAEVVGVGTGTIAAYEAGRIHPSPKIISRLQEVYGLELTRPPRKNRKGVKTLAGKAGALNAAHAGKPADDTAVYIQLADQRVVTPEAIREKVRAEAGPVDEIRIRIDEGKIYWVKGGEEGGGLDLSEAAQAD